MSERTCQFDSDQGYFLKESNVSMDANQALRTAELMKKYPAEEKGVWTIRGEDPNCDFGGQHYEPYLDTVECTYKDAVAYAVTLPSFWGWGSGGSITKAPIPKQISPEFLEARDELLDKKKALEQDLAKINKTLEGYISYSPARY